jgi:uncharacterized protein (UPF0264 family)
MTQILISVRSLAEAKLLPLERIGIVDIKEPHRGPLGRADDCVVAEILSEVAGRTKVSAAMGEVCEPASRPMGLPPISYAKFGLGQSGRGSNWATEWGQRLRELPDATQPVAVIYADWQSAQAPSPMTILEEAKRLGCRAVLVDTYDKSGDSVFSHLPIDDLRDIKQFARSSGMKFVLAGGIGSDSDLELALSLEPDYLGVRGAVCEQSRVGEVSVQRLSDFLCRFEKLVEHL